MPQLDFFYFLGEGVVTLFFLYCTIYLYLFWFSKVNFETWLLNYRFNYYFEKIIIFVFFNITKINNNTQQIQKNYYQTVSLYDSILNSLTNNAIE